MNYENALNFLLYSYFGILPQSIYNEMPKNENQKEEYRDYCIKMIIIKAYDDATGEGAYNTLFNKAIPSEELKLLKDFSNDAKKKSAKYLFAEIKNFVSPRNYDEWHKDICDNLVQYYADVSNDNLCFFTHGNAQKWVNMTMKYLWLLGLLPKGLKEEYLHIPIDSYIIDELWCNNNIVFPPKVDSPGKRNRDYVQPSNYVKPWSKWNYKNDYKNYRKSLNKKSYDLSWENAAWIKRSEIRKNKEKTKKYNEFFDNQLSSAGI